MTTVLIEDYALLSVAVRHVLERARSADHVLSASSDDLELVAPRSAPVALAVLGCTGKTLHDMHMLVRALTVLDARVTLMLYPTLDRAVMIAAARAGVAGYLPKSSSPQALTAAIHLVMAGGECYPMPVMATAEGTLGEVRAVMPLTQRQAQILRLMVQGKTMRQISDEVGTSVATVKSHARALYWKLNARNQAAAVYIAVHWGLVPGDARVGDDQMPAGPSWAHRMV